MSGPYVNTPSPIPLLKGFAVLNTGPTMSLLAIFSVLATSGLLKFSATATAALSMCHKSQLSYLCPHWGRGGHQTTFTGSHGEKATDADRAGFSSPPLSLSQRLTICHLCDKSQPGLRESPGAAWGTQTHQEFPFFLLTGTSILTFSHPAYIWVLEHSC